MDPATVRPVSAGAATGRALRLRCLVCGETPMFTGLFAMHERCSACRFTYEREPGYFLGSIYFGYGGLALVTMVAAVLMQFVFRLSLWWILGSLSAFALAFTTLGFRHARAAWMVLDLLCDPPKDEDFKKEPSR